MHRLLEILDRLRAPDGCPWDRDQTFESLREKLLEEAQEVVEAVESGDRKNLCEELGDLLVNVGFYCKMAEEEGSFSFDDVISQVIEKLIRRHPHVFGDAKATTPEEAKAQWQRMKLAEKAGSV
jgi:MazG family protein